MLKNLFGPLNRDDDELDEEGLEIIYMDEDEIEELAEELGIYAEGDWDN